MSQYPDVLGALQQAGNVATTAKRGRLADLQYLEAQGQIEDRKNLRSLMPKAIQGDKEAMSEISKLDPELFTSLDERQREMALQRSKKMGSLLASVSQVPEEMRPMAYNHAARIAVKELGVNPAEIPPYDPQRLQLMLDQQREIEDILDQTGKSGGGIGTYNPRDYTTESWTKFTKTRDPSVLERYENSVKARLYSDPELADRAISVEGDLAGAKSGRSEQEKLNVQLEMKPKIAEKTAEATAIGKSRGESQNQLPEATATANYSLDLLDKALDHPGLDTATGASSRFDPRNYTPGTDAYDFNVLMDQIQGRTFLAAFESLKGGGQITEVEGKKAEQSIARLNKAQSKEAFVEALTELKGIIQKGVERAKQKAGQSPSTFTSSSGIQFTVE